MKRPELPQPSGEGSWSAKLYQQLQAFFSDYLDGPWICKDRLTTMRGRTVNVTLVTSAAYDVLKADHIVEVNYAGAVALNLPAQPTKGWVVEIVDGSGAAASNNITIAGNGNDVNGGLTVTLSTNYGRRRIHFNGTQWVAG